MTKILNTNDVLGALQSSGNPRYEYHRVRLEDALHDAAQDLASHHGIAVSETSTQLGFGGLCSHFKPAFDGQQWPADLEDYDPEGEFE